MKLKQLYIATLIVTVPATSIFAAALERSNQSIQAFLESGNYIEAGVNITDQNITGKTTKNLVGNFASNTGSTYRNLTNQDTGSVGDTYFTPHITAKIQASEKLSLGLIYDEPFAINTHYKNPSNYMSTSNSNSNFKTGLDLQTKNISLMIGFQPTHEWNYFIGLVNQQMNGKIGYDGLQLGYITPTLTPFNGYHSSFRDNAFGWLTGISYQNNERSLKTSITYRSKINHKFNPNEDDRLNADTAMPAAQKPDMIALLDYKTGHTGSFNTPQSINLDMSKQIANTTAFINIRWIDWSNVDLNLPYFRAKSGYNYPYANNPQPPPIQ